MYNKAKRGLELAGAIIAICIGAFEVISGIVSTITLIDLLDRVYYPEELILPIILCTFDIAIGIVLLCLGPKLCRKAKQVNGVWEKRLGVNITLLVFLGVLMIFSFIGFMTTLVIFMLMLIICDIALIIVAMCLKNKDGVVENKASKSEQVAVDSAITTKIAELKRLKELGIITDEQYEMAIDKLLKETL